MTRFGHFMTAAGLSLAAVAFATQLHAAVPAAVLGGVIAGANAPDSLEIAWFDASQMRRRSIIPHRTLTHWLPLWIAALMAGFAHLNVLWGCALFGFAIGGLCHLAVDLPNPTGIPVWTPFGKRWSLKWWKSGEMELPLIAAIWVPSFLYFQKIILA